MSGLIRRLGGLANSSSVTTKHRIAILGSGNFGSAIASIVGRNVSAHTSFEPEVRMWVYEEMVQGQKLTEIINSQHENVKYLPGIRFPDNVVAVADQIEAVRDATMLVFVMPHQFVGDLCRRIRPHVHPNAIGISLIKGMALGADEEPVLISQSIQKLLGRHFSMSVLSGANIATEVAAGPLSEATIGSKVRAEAVLWRKVFHCPSFRVSITDDVAGVELCGALKNIVAVAAGLCDGLKVGNNTKVAVIRIGFAEMQEFISIFFAGVRPSTFFESCGMADLVVTCFSGRNRKVAAAHAETGRPFEQLEKEMLNGQKLQGTLTAHEVHTILKKRHLTASFPLFTAVYKIVYEGAHPSTIYQLSERDHIAHL